jgi:hypothetical protein
MGFIPGIDTRAIQRWIRYGGFTPGGIFCFAGLAISLTKYYHVARVQLPFDRGRSQPAGYVLQGIELHLMPASAQMLMPVLPYQGQGYFKVRIASIPSTRFHRSELRLRHGSCIVGSMA